MKPKRKYTKRKFSAATNDKAEGKTDKRQQIKSTFDAKLISSDLTRFSRVYCNDILVCIREMALKVDDIKKSPLINELSEIIQPGFQEDAQAELTQNQVVMGIEILNLKTNNKLWIFKPVWESFIESKL